MAFHTLSSSFIGFPKGDSHRSLNYVKGFWLSPQIWLIHGYGNVLPICRLGDSYGEPISLIRLLALQALSHLQGEKNWIERLSILVVQKTFLSLMMDDLNGQNSG